MNADNETGRTLDDIEVMDVSRLEWRVSDTRISTDDARSVIGFIEKKAGVFEVLMFGDPLRFSMHDTMDAAIEDFVTARPEATLLRGLARLS